MPSGTKGIGPKKHARSGCRNGNGKSPKLRHHLKLKAEAQEVKDNSRIKDPKEKPSDVFKRG